MAPMRMVKMSRRAAGWMGRTVTLVLFGTAPWLHAQSSGSTDQPLLDLFIKKGFVTEDEAEKVKAEADANRTNAAAAPTDISKWMLSKGLKNVELFGDIRSRYESRTAKDPSGGKIDEERYRYAIRVGLRGQIFDDFYYGLRLETSANPRSPWVTMGSSTSGNPYQGPYGKSTSTIGVGQAYLGWHPESWVDITVGKMANPLYTTPMVWDTDINPEGAAERFKYTVGEADFFATFGQFIYEDPTPTTASSGLLSLGGLEQNGNNVYQFAWQLGADYHATPTTSAKVAATLYNYTGLHQSSASSSPMAPYFGDPYVGEGAYTGAGSGVPVNGYAGYGTPGSVPGFLSQSYPNNQVGLNHLLIVEVPFEVNFNLDKVHLRLFGDVAYNLQGNERAQDAVKGYSAYLTSQPNVAAGFPKLSLQKQDCKAYQAGFAIGSTNIVYGPAQGAVYGTSSARHAWEFRAYWQHVEQYSLDPNLIDSDFFEGRENMEGIYAAVAYHVAANFILTFRYGHADRINGNLGTGGSNQDVPWMNPIQHYDLLQADATVKF